MRRVEVQTRTRLDGASRPKERRRTQATPKVDGAMVLLPNSTAASTSHAVPEVLEIRHQQIATAAYLRAEKRGFAPGHELEDWLAAEQEIDEKVRYL